MMNLIKNKLTPIIISSLVVVALIISLTINGLDFGIEFTGGTSAGIKFQKDISTEVLSDELGIEDIRRSDGSFVVRTESLSENQRQEFVSKIQELDSSSVIESFTTFGPSISSEIISKSIITIIAASILILLFVTISFASVSQHYQSFKYGVVAIVALLHDTLIPIGVFSLLGVYGASVDVFFVTAILATLGYSINDTIVIFDRVRENLSLAMQKTKGIIDKAQFTAIVEKSISQSLSRSIRTSLTTSIPLILLAIFVPQVKWFSVTLLIGVIAGTYSSLFIAPILLIFWYSKENLSEKKKNNDIADMHHDLIKDIKRTNL